MGKKSFVGSKRIKFKSFLMTFCALYIHCIICRPKIYNCLINSAYDLGQGRSVLEKGMISIACDLIFCALGRNDDVNSLYTRSTCCGVADSFFACALQSIAEIKEHKNLSIFLRSIYIFLTCHHDHLDFLYIKCRDLKCRALKCRDSSRRSCIIY